MSVGSGNHEFQNEDDGLHIPFFATYSNSANRLSDTRLTGPRVEAGKPSSPFRALVAGDLFKFALQTDDNSIWMLLTTAPTWATLFTGDASRIDVLVLKGSAGTLTRGQVVYASGWNDLAGVPEAELARADSASTMPAVGVVLEDITDSVQGEVRVFGVVTGVDTSAFSQGDPLYISTSVAGEFVTPRPTGATDLIQFFGTALRIHATLGSHGAGGSLRANSLPNLTKDKIWQGDPNNQPVEVPFTSQSVLRNSKTGLIDTPNGLLAINVDTTKFDVKDSTGQIVDYSTPGATTLVPLTWTGLTAITVTNLATAPFSVIYIEDTGGGVPGVVQTTAAGIGTDRRDKIFLGLLIHVGNTVIESVSNIPIPAYDVGGSLDDLILALGDFNRLGNVYGPNGANLLADKSAGLSFGRQINAEIDILNPNNKTNILQPGITTYIYSFRNGLGGFASSVEATIDPDSYDDGTVTLGTVPANKFTIQRLNFDPRTDLTIPEYGQTIYNTLPEAIDGISANAVVKNPTLAPLILRGWLVVQQGATALDVAADAEFVEFTDELTQGSGFGVDINAIHVDQAAEISAIALKASPVAADHMVIEDTADANAKKRATAGSIAALAAVDTVDPERFQIVAQELQFSDNMESTLDFFLGAIIETIVVTVTEAAGVVTLNLAELGGGDLTIIFSDGFYVFDVTPAATIVLTAGTIPVPVRNRIYILQSTKALTVSTTGFPAAEHAPIADVYVQSAAGVAADGVFKLHEWTDHASLSGNNGHISHLNEALRIRPARWISGVDPTLTITPGSPDTVILTTASGIVFQLHKHAFPAFTPSPSYFIANDSVTANVKVADLNVLLTDSLGVSMSGRYFPLVVWGVVSANAADSKLFLNLPSGSYNNETALKEDVSNFANFDIPTAFVGTGFLVVLLNLRHQITGGGTWTSIEEIDLRGRFPSNLAGGGSIPTSEFPDSIFSIFDDADSTSRIAFNAGLIATATTRTYTAPDRDITLGQYKSHLTFGDASISTSTTTRYLFPWTRDGATAHTVESAVQLEMTFPGTASKLRLVQDAGIGGGTITYTVRKGGSDQALVIAGAPTITTGSDLVNSFTFAAGDKVSVSAAKSAGITFSPGHIRLSMELLAS